MAGVTVERAAAIVKIYHSPKALMAAYVLSPVAPFCVSKVFVRKVFSLLEIGLP